MSTQNHVSRSRVAYARALVGLFAVTVFACAPAPTPSPTLTPGSPSPAASLIPSEVIPGSWTLVSFGAPW